MDKVRVDHHLRDRRIVDRDGVELGAVDDVELATGPDGRPVVTALLVGPQVLGERIGGGLGQWLAFIVDRLGAEPPAPPRRIPYELVGSVDREIALLVPMAALPPWPQPAHVSGPGPGQPVRLGQSVYDRAGSEVGRIADLLSRPDAHGVLRIYAALVRVGRHGRRPTLHEIAWEDIRLRRSYLDGGGS